MLKLRTKSITTQIVIVTVCLALVPIVLLGWLANKQKIHETSASELLHIQTVLQNITSKASFEIDRQKTIIKTLANTPVLISSIEKKLNENQDLLTFLSFYKNTYNYKNIYIFTDQKIIFLKTSMEDTFGNSNLEEAFLSKLVEKTFFQKSPQVSDLIKIDSTDRYSAFITSPIFKNEKILGVIVARLDEGFFTQLLSTKADLKKTGKIIVEKKEKDGLITSLFTLTNNRAFLEESSAQFRELKDKGFGEIRDLNKNLILAAWDSIPSLNWRVQIQVDKKEVLKNIRQSNHNIIIIVFGVLAIILLLAIYSSRLLVSPLLHLVDSIKRFSQGDQLCVLSGSSYEITLLSKTFNQMSDKINTTLETLKKQAETIDKHNQNLESQIFERTKALDEKHRHIRSLLDNSGQGFLSCDSSLHIRDEYSKECEVLFETPIAGTYLPKRLFSDKSKQETFEKTLTLYFKAQDPFQQEAFLSLLDTKTKLGNHQVSIEYKPMDDNTIMLIITDISKVCELEEKLQDERQMLSFITTALKDKRQFFDSIEAFETEIDALYQKIKKEKKLSFEQIQIFYRKIHTHKGIFSQYALPNLPQTLHFLESDLFKKLSDNRLSSEFSQNYFDEAIEAKNRDISILAKYLGEDFINQKEILSISSTKLESLESFANKINDKLGDPHPLSREIKALIKDLRLVPLKNLLLAYPNLALHLATSMEKEIEPFDIAGGDFLVDPRRYSGFTKALIHLFNNAVDHGIEPIDERLELGKPAAGSLSCTITQTPGFFHLQLSDDGRGLNAETIKVKAMEKGIKIPKDLSDKDACLLIFNDDFSLKQDVTQVSGRGIGLSALKAETEALGGTVDVTSILGYGSTFYFKIPYFPKKEL